VGDAQGGAGGGPVAGAVAGAVVADHALDSDAGGVVPGGGGFLFLVFENLGVSQPGVIIESGVQVAVAQDGDCPQIG
jgi:hypothetical protein